MIWFNRGLLAVNLALFAVFLYLIFFRASYAAAPIEWSRTDAITIVLASLAVVLAALTIFLAVLAIWAIPIFVSMPLEWRRMMRSR